MLDNTQTKDALILAEALATRMCHDLSGQLNALMGAVELIREEPGAAEEAMLLASDAASALGRRLRLLRAAWGGNAAPLAVHELGALTDGMFGRRLRVDLSGLPSEGSFSPIAARLLLNVVLLAAESLPSGGVVELSGDPGRDLLVTIDGPRAAWPVGLAAMLADPGQARDWLRSAEGVSAARALQGPLTALIAHATGLRLSFLMAAEVQVAPPLLVTLVRLH